MVQLFKDQLLGLGSYGAVCKAKSGELLCAAKIINPNLLDPTVVYRIKDGEREGSSLWNETRWFKEESEFLFKLRHPNLVQYLGLCQDPDTQIPVLLLELMKDSLTRFLKVPQIISYHVQVDICHNITQGLSFLHSNNIIHKNLCSNNVLLDESCAAKLTDFGMATLAELNPRKTHFPFLAVQDKRDYMPPEALKEEPVYTEKTDCFSFGVIVVQLLTRQPPSPGNRQKSVKLNKAQAGLPRNLSIPVSEIERRQSHIDLINRHHPLLCIALNCFKDIDIERPSSEELCSKIGDLKGSSEYKKSLRSSQETRQKTKQAANSTDRQILELQTKVDQLMNELAQKNCVIASSRAETERLHQQIQEMHSKSKEVEKIEEELQRKYRDFVSQEKEKSKKAEQTLCCRENGTCKQVLTGKQDQLNYH